MKKILLIILCIFVLVGCKGEEIETGDSSPLFPPPTAITVGHEEGGSTVCELFPGSEAYDYFYDAICKRTPMGGTVPYEGEWDDVGVIRAKRIYVSFIYDDKDFRSSVLYEEDPVFYLNANEPEKKHYSFYMIFPFSGSAPDSVVVQWYSSPDHGWNAVNYDAFGYFDTSNDDEIRQRIRDYVLAKAPKETTN